MERLVKRRYAYPLLALIGLGVVSAGGARRVTAGSTSPNDVDGQWHYRSFVNTPTTVSDLNSILFGEGELVFAESPTGTLSGTGDFGGGDSMRYTGSVSHGGWITIRFQGVGVGQSNRDWLYDYVGVLTPQWPNGVGQAQVIVGSVVRSAPHSNGSGGTVPAGKVASFIAIRH